MAADIGVNLSNVAAVGAHASRITEGSRIRGIPPEDWETVYRAYRRKTCPAAAPRWRGRIQSAFKSGHGELTFAPGRRILLNATPANGLSAPTSDRPENAECNAPELGCGCALPAATPIAV